MIDPRSYTQLKQACTGFELTGILGYLKDSNAPAHSVDSDIFYAVIYLSARSKICSNIYFSK